MYILSTCLLSFISLNVSRLQNLYVLASKLASSVFIELGKAIIICHLQCHGSGFKKYVYCTHVLFAATFFFAQTTRRHLCHDEGEICIQKRQFNTYFPTQKSVRILQLCCVTRLFCGRIVNKVNDWK